MVTGDIVYVRYDTPTISGAAITLGEKLEDGVGTYTHVCIYIGNGQVAEAQGGRVTGSAPLSEYAGHCDIGEFDWTPVQRQRIVQVAKSHYGIPYNWLEIAEIALDDLTHIQLPLFDHHDFICSEYVKAIIKLATGVVLCDKQFTTPQDIALYPNQRITSG